MVYILLYLTYRSHKQLFVICYTYHNIKLICTLPCVQTDREVLPIREKWVPIQLGSVHIFLGRYFIGLLISVSVNTRLLTTIISRYVSSAYCCCSRGTVSALKPSYSFLVCALRTRNTRKRGGKRSTSLWCSSISSYTFWKKRVKTSDQMTDFVRAQKICFSFFSICSLFPELVLLFIIMEKTTFISGMTSHPLDYKNIG